MDMTGEDLLGRIYPAGVGTCAGIYAYRGSIARLFFYSRDGCWYKPTVLWPYIRFCAAGERTNSSFYVYSNPIEECFVPELAVQRLQNPVAFIRKYHQLRRHSLALERIEEFQRLRVRDAKILFTRDNQRRRFVFSKRASVICRRPFAISIWIRPRRSLQIVLLEPQLFRRIHGNFVVHAG